MQLLAYGKVAFRVMKEQVIFANLSKTLRVMKLTALLLTVAFMHASASGDAQKINLSVKDAPLQNVFVELQRQSGYSFVYTDAQAKKFRLVTATIKDEEIREALTLCLKDQQFTFEIINNTLVTLKPKGKSKNIQFTETNEKVSNSGLTTRDVKGKVLNENGQPVSGVTVAVKGTNISVITDVNGEFAIHEISTDAILVFTHVSMETFELKVSGQEDLLVRLKTKISELSNVTVSVSTGYQDIPKERATGSFVKIENETLNQQVGTNVLQRLRGVTSSLLFDTKNRSGGGGIKESIVVRGLSTINGPTDPLIIVDNFPYEGDFNNINPNDVESITILKDASASSIWGAKAANGVIVITTKKGKLNQPFRVEMNTNIIITEEPDLFELPQMFSADYIEVEELLFNKGAFNSLINRNDRPGLTPAVEIFLKRRNGQISASDSAHEIEMLKRNDIRNDFKKYFYQKSINQQYALNVGGGKDNISYLFSVGYDKNIGISDQKFERLNLRLQNTFNLNKNIQVNISTFYTNSKTASGKPTYGSVNIRGRQIPYLKFADESGNALPIYLLRQGYIDTAGNGKLLDWRYYPLENFQHNTSNGRLQDLLINFGARYQIFQPLTFNVNYQYQIQQIKDENHQDVHSYEARDLINTFSQLNRNTGQIKYIVPLGGMLREASNSIEVHNVRALLNYDYTWSKYSLAAIVGSELREITNQGATNTAYGYNEELLTTAPIDFVNPYPTFINGLQRTIEGSPTYRETISRFVSFFGNAAFTLSNKYTISGSFRKDASNVFGLNTNDKWNPLWSSGLAWNISREPFYHINFLSSLRIRATYGYSGNLDLSKSAATVMRHFFSTNSITNLPFGVISQFQNNELRWEKVRTFNLGFDFTTQKQVFSGSIEYYRKRAIDLFGPSPLDYTAGLQTGTITKNVAKMVGNGIDVVLNTRILNHGIKWNSSIIFNFYSDRVTEYFTEPGGVYGPTFSSQISPLEGKPVYSVLSYRWAGLDPTNGNPRGFLNAHPSTDYNSIANALTSPDSLVYSGAATPKYFGSIINTITYKGFSFSANFTYKFGYYFRKNSISYEQLFNSGVGHADFAKRWRSPGDEAVTNVPSLLYPLMANRDAFYLLSEATVEKGDHIRLQYVNLSYDFGSSILKRKAIQSLEVYLNVSNIGIIWRSNKDRLDPDYVYSNFVLPPLRSFAVGVRANF